MSTENDANKGSPAAGCKQETDYVLVADPSSGEKLELPTNPDNSLNMSTLQAAFAGATGLKYKNPKTGASRTVMVDSSGATLLPPADGWGDKEFQAIIAAVAPARGADVSVKRRKMGDSDDEDDSEGEGRYGRKRLAESSPAVIERRPVDLIVLGINFKTTDEAFKAYFETFGPVAFAEVKKNPEGNSKGFGFVQMTTIEDQDKVLSVLSHSIDGRRCEVKLPDQRSQFTQFDQYARDIGTGTPLGKRPSKPVISKVFVGRLVDKISDSMLREFFEEEARKVDPSCTVTDVFIPTPFRGFGFVTFSSADVADKICKRGNYVVEGVSLAVSLAVPKETNPYGSPANVGYHNEQGYSYGYGKGGAGYGSPSFRQEDFRPRYDQNVYGASPYDSPRRAYDPMWQGPSTTPARPGPNWVPPRPGRRSTASPGFQPHPSPSGVHAPAYPPQPLIPPPGSADSVVPSQIANGLDALDLNQKNNPDLYHAAWSAFYNTLQAANGGPMPSRGPPHPGWQK